MFQRHDIKRAQSVGWPRALASGLGAPGGEAPRKAQGDSARDDPARSLRRLRAADGAPDPRLIDRLGSAACLSMGLLPWRDLGGLVLIAAARPEDFARHLPALQAVFGPVALALTTERRIQDALLACRREALRLHAETCVPGPMSCRQRDSGRFNRLVLSAALALAAGLVWAPGATLIALFAVVVAAQAAGTALKIAAALTQARAVPVPPALPEERADPCGRPATDGNGGLPVISVMVPMYHEPDIAPRLVARLGALNYPRDRLDILLVVEEDDRLTRDALAAADLPGWMRVIPVPHSPLRTKPRALNYALGFARGSIIGVYDAEDAPDPDQLFRVARRFGELPPTVACLQGMLDYYNPATNWLSRCFTIEYAVWFRLVLPGLDRLGLVVPLGGTTLFFRRALLEELGGWDAHNVTEDADLGVRLARHGYRTELIDTVTLEEANCRVWPWIKQRSRWLKGYAMTYAVHMRDPVALWRALGAWRFLGVQVLFLGTLIQFFLAPLLWSFWLFLLGVEHPIAATLPGWLLGAVLVLFLGSEVAGLAIAWVALGRAGHRALRPWALSLSLYFPLAAIAAYKALWEMVRSPFYWDKTAHGLHDTDLMIPRHIRLPVPVAATDPDARRSDTRRDARGADAGPWAPQRGVSALAAAAVT